MDKKYQQTCDDLLVLLQGLKASLAVFSELNDLTPPQMWALYILLRGETTMGKLAMTLHCDASNVTGIVDRLVVQDLITSKMSLHDRRAKVLALTVKGRSIVETYMRELPDQLGVEKLDEKDCQNLHTIVTKMQ
jgi:DNA-binding MarR family transcriptional regulator